MRIIKDFGIMLLIALGVCLCFCAALMGLYDIYQATTQPEASNPPDKVYLPNE